MKLFRRGSIRRNSTEVKADLSAVTVRGGSSSRHSERSSTDTDVQWTLEGWLQSLTTPSSILADALLAGASGETDELTYAATLTDRVHVLSLLKAAQVLEALAEFISMSSGQALAKEDSPLVSPRTRGSASRHSMTKFEAEPDVLQYTTLSTFWLGLNGVLGPPNPNLMNAMARDHCGEADACVAFTTANYGVTTTARIEWHFVVSPLKGLAELRRSRHRVVRSLVKNGYPTETLRGGTPRQPRPLEAFAGALSDVNDKLHLQDVGARLLKEELIAGRLCMRTPRGSNYQDRPARPHFWYNPLFSSLLVSALDCSSPAGVGRHGADVLQVQPRAARASGLGGP